MLAHNRTSFEGCWHSFLLSPLGPLGFALKFLTMACEEAVPVKLLARPADEAEAAKEEFQLKLPVESALQKFGSPGLLGGWPCTPLLLSTLLEVGRAFRSTLSPSVH